MIPGLFSIWHKKTWAVLVVVRGYIFSHKFRLRPRLLKQFISKKIITKIFYTATMWYVKSFFINSRARRCRPKRITLIPCPWINQGESEWLMGTIYRRKFKDKNGVTNKHPIHTNPNRIGVNRLLICMSMRMFSIVFQSGAGLQINWDYPMKIFLFKTWHILPVYEMNDDI